MEIMGEPRPFPGPWNLLGVPVPDFHSIIDVDDDEGEEVVIRIRPKSSPLPRRRSGDLSDGESEPETMPSRSRRVSFADANGLSLVRVKEFDKWDIPNLPGFASLDREIIDQEEFYVSAPFSLPLSAKDVATRVQENKLGLETVEFIPGTTTLRGVIRVLNLSFDKMVYVRTTLDAWASHFDLLAEYVPGSSDGVTDCFAFKLTLVPPFEEQGAKVEFCLRYDTSVGTFWDNNRDENYVLSCHQRAKETQEEVPKQPVPVCKKSCLKTISHIFTTGEDDSSLENSSLGVSTHEAVTSSVTAQQSSDSLSGDLEESRQKLLVENSRNSKRRNRRRAARLARVKDHFTQKDAEPADIEHEESLPDTTPTTQGEKATETHSNKTSIQSFPEELDKYSHSEPITESLTTSGNPDVQCKASTVQDDMTHIDSENSESMESLQNQRPSETSDNGGKLSAERQNHINSNSRVMSDESHTADKSYRTVSSAESVEGFVNQDTGFTFETVVAPLYHQVVGTVGGESRNLEHMGNTVRGRVNEGVSSFYTAQCLHTERRKASDTAIHCCNPAGITRELVNETQEFVWSEDDSKWCLNTTLSKTIEATTSVSPGHSSEEIPGHPIETLESHQQCIGPKPISKNVMELPATANVSNAEEFKMHSIPRESSHLQEKDQEDILTNDVENKALVQTQDEAQVQHPFPENTDAACIQPLSSQLQVSQVSDHFNGCVDQLTTSDKTIETLESHQQCISENVMELLATANVSNAEEFKMHSIPRESSHLQEKDQEDILTNDVENKALVQTQDEAQVQHPCPENTDAACIQPLSSQLQVSQVSDHFNGCVDQLTASDKPIEHECIHESKEDEDIPATVSAGTLGMNSEQEKTMVYFEHCNGECRDDSATTSAENSTTCIVSSVETIEGQDIVDIALNSSLVLKMETNMDKRNEVTDDSSKEETKKSLENVDSGELMKKDMMSTCHLYTDIVSEITDKITVEENALIISGKPESTPVTDVVTKPMEVKVETEGKDWEMMVEEEEVDVLRDDEGSEKTGNQPEKEMDALAKEKDEQKQELPEERGLESEETERERKLSGATVAEKQPEKDGDVEENVKEEIMAGELVIWEEGRIGEEEQIGEVSVEEDIAGMQEDEVIRGEDEEETETEETEGEVNEGEEEEICVEWEEKQMKVNREDMEEVITEEGDGEIVVGKRDEAAALDQSLSTTINKVHEGASEREGDTTEYTCGKDEMHISTEGYNQSDSVVTGQSKATCHSESGRDDPAATDRVSLDLMEEPESDQTDDEDSASSTDSQSDDEVELYMHCLRATHKQSLRPATLNHSKEKSLSAAKRPSIGRNRSLSMPSISESMDEEQPSGSLQHDTENTEREEATPAPTPAPTPLPVTGGLDRSNTRVAWWKETFSCSNISKALLYTSITMFFFFVAYHYNFLAYFALYLLSVFWLYGQGEKQPVKKQNFAQQNAS